MIYRKWSLLTGPAVILGGIVGTVIVADYLFFNTGPSPKQEHRKLDVPPSKE